MSPGGEAAQDGGHAAAAVPLHPGQAQGALSSHKAAVSGLLRSWKVEVLEGCGLLSSVDAMFEGRACVSNDASLF